MKSRVNKEKRKIYIALIANKISSGKAVELLVNLGISTIDAYSLTKIWLPKNIERKQNEQINNNLQGVVK